MTVAPDDEQPVDGVGEGAGDDGSVHSETKELFRFGSHERRMRSVTHSLFLLVGAFLFAAIVAEGGRQLLHSGGLTRETAPVTLQLVPMALHFLGLLLAVVAYISTQSARSLVRLGPPTPRQLGWVLVGTVGLVGALTGLDVLLGQFGYEPAENVSVEAGREHPELFLYFIPVVILLNAPAEELLFRGVIQGLFRRAYGVVPAIFAAAVVFGLVHYVALVGTGSRFAYVGIALVSGVVLGALYEYTDNLAVPILVHAGWNVLVYVSLYVETTGLP